MRTPPSFSRCAHVHDVNWAGSIGRRNTLIKEVAMKAHRRRSDQCIRNKLRSPGRPPVWQRENLRRFWKAIASGRSSEDSAMDAGVSVPVGVRWFRHAGGIPPTHLAPSARPSTGRYLTFLEREDIAIEFAKGTGIRAMARKLGRSPSTISRELRRNAVTRGGRLDYRGITAQWHADRASSRPRICKRATNAVLRDTARRSGPARPL